MRSIVAFMALICFGCASQSPVDEPEVAGATAQIADANSAPASTSPVRSAGGGAGANDVPHGYHLVDRDGQKFYCSDKPAFGTRVKSRVTCISAEQFEQARNDARDKMREKQGQRIVDE